MSDQSLGKAVLELSTDPSQLNQGLTDAKKGSKELGDKFKEAGNAAKSFSLDLGDLREHLALGVTQGMLLHDAIREVITIIKDIPADIGEIISRGSKVQDVSDAFDRLTESAGGSVAVLAALRAGTKGTVGDFELMKVANTLLSDGVKLTADQFGLLASGARQLAKQTGVDTVEAFDMLAHAMETGKGKALNAIGVHVDLDATLARYSDTIGKNVVDLTAQDKTAAFTAETLRQLAANQKAVGDQALSAGEKIQAGKVYLENLEDEVDRGIANSPVLAAAMDGIATTFQHAFGADQQAQVTTIVTLVGDVAIVAAKTAGFLLTLGNDIRDFFTKAGAGLQQYVLSYTEREQRDVEKLLATYEKVGTGQSAAVKARIADLRSQLDGLRAYNATLTQEINGGLESNDKVNKLVEQGQKDIAAMVAAMEQAQAAHAATAAAASTHGTAVGDLSDHYVKLTAEQKAQRKAMEDILAAAIPLTEAQQAAAVANEALGVSASTTAKALGISAEAVDHYLKSLKETQAIADTWEKFHAHLLEVSNQFIIKWIDSTTKAAQKVADGEAKELATQLTAYADYQEKNYQLTLRGTDLLVEQLEVQRKAAIAKLGQRFAGEGPIYDMALAQINKFYDHQVTAAKDAFAAIAKELGVLGQAFTQLGNDIGGVTGAIVTGLGHVSASFGQAASAASAFNKAAAADDFAGMTTGILGIVDAGVQLGNMLAKVTATAQHPGGLLGLRTGWLGDVVGTNNLGRSIVETFAAANGGFDALHAHMLATLPDAERLWTALTQLANNADPVAAQKAIDNITKAFDAAGVAAGTFNASLNPLLTQLQAIGGTLPTELIAELQRAGVLTDQNAGLLAKLGETGGPTLQQLTALQQKYNLTTAQMGPAFQQANDTAGWQGIIDDLKTATDGGLDLNAVLAGMSPTISKLVQDSLQFQTTIPANMRETVETLFNQGELLDANGKKITDISKLTFGKDLPSSIDKLTLAVEALTKAFEGTKHAVGQIPTSVEVDFHATKSGDWSGAAVRSGDDPLLYPDAGRAGAAALRVPSYQMPALVMPSGAAFHASSMMAGLTSIAGRPNETHVVVELDSRVLAKGVVRHMPNELARVGVGR